MKDVRSTHRDGCRLVRFYEIQGREATLRSAEASRKRRAPAQSLKKGNGWRFMTTKSLSSVNGKHLPVDPRLA